MAGASNAEHLLARKTAEEFRSKGYEVTLDAPLDFFPGYRADLRSVSFTRSGKPKGGYYSFIVNRGSLLFYVRRPALCEAWTRQRAELQDHFGGRYRENPAGEWTVDVRTVDDVHYLETASCRTPYPMRHGDN